MWRWIWLAALPDECAVVFSKMQTPERWRVWAIGPAHFLTQSSARVQDSLADCTICAEEANRAQKGHRRLRDVCSVPYHRTCSRVYAGVPAKRCSRVAFATMGSTLPRFSEAACRRGSASVAAVGAGPSMPLRSLSGSATELLYRGGVERKSGLLPQLTKTPSSDLNSFRSASAVFSPTFDTPCGGRVTSGGPTREGLRRRQKHAGERFLKWRRQGALFCARVCRRCCRRPERGSRRSSEGRIRGTPPRTPQARSPGSVFNRRGRKVWYQRRGQVGARRQAMGAEGACREGGSATRSAADARASFRVLRMRICGLSSWLKSLSPETIVTWRLKERVRDPVWCHWHRRRGRIAFTSACTSLTASFASKKLTQHTGGESQHSLRRVVVGCSLSRCVPQPPAAPRRRGRCWR